MRMAPGAPRCMLAMPCLLLGRQTTPRFGNEVLANEEAITRRR
jgi:hypothetical protein